MGNFPPRLLQLRVSMSHFSVTKCNSLFSGKSLLVRTDGGGSYTALVSNKASQGHFRFLYLGGLPSSISECKTSYTYKLHTYTQGIRLFSLLIIILWYSKASKKITSTLKGFLPHFFEKGGGSEYKKGAGFFPNLQNIPCSLQKKITQITYGDYTI